MSKKRKKNGKTVHRTHSAGEEHAHGPEQKQQNQPQRVNKPTNPFVTNQQGRRGAQRGR